MTKETGKNGYQAHVIKELRKRYPSCIILKNDPNYLQGVPDLVIFYGPHYALLECKASAKAKTRPNQEHYVRRFNDMSFAAFIYPENEEEVLDALQQSFST